MKNLYIVIGVIVLFGIGGFVYVQTQKQSVTTQDKAMMQKDTTLNNTNAMKKDEGTKGEKMMKTEGYSGKVIAGTNVPYLDFNKSDYDRALAEGKVIVLNFYANWCPVCRAETSDLAAGFDALTAANVVAFRVNYKDSDTDKDEEVLAKQFTIPYQHTKVILKGGKEVYKSTVQWSKEDLINTVTKYAGS